MNLLIVEDDENKRSVFQKYFKTSFPSFSLTFSKSYQSGLHDILKTKPQFLILDMTIPTYDITANEPNPPPMTFGGKEIVLQLAIRDIFIPTVIISQFETFGENDEITLLDLDIDMKKLYQNSYLGVIKYKIGVESWQDQLSSIILKELGKK